MDTNRHDMHIHVSKEQWSKRAGALDGGRGLSADDKRLVNTFGIESSRHQHLHRHRALPGSSLCTTQRRQGRLQTSQELHARPRTTSQL